jgi:hypothetical protein
MIDEFIYDRFRPNELILLNWPDFSVILTIIKRFDILLQKQYNFKIKIKY